MRSNPAVERDSKRSLDAASGEIQDQRPRMPRIALRDIRATRSEVGRLK